jgi:hypothetical protein
LARKANTVAQRVQRGARTEWIVAPRADRPCLELERAATYENRKMNGTLFGPDYSVFFHSSGEPLHSIEMHVLARAYRAAWRSQFASEPLGHHVIAPLDVLLVFSGDGDGTSRRDGPSVLML